MSLNLKYLPLFILIINSNFSSGQQITFEKNYDFGYADVAYCVQQTPDSGYIMAGRQGIAPFYEKMVIAKTDKYGIQQWSKILGSSTNSAWANYIVNCTNGGYAAVGYKYDVNYRYDVFVVRLNNNGDTLWTRHYGTTAFNERGTCIKETSDKGFVVSFTQEPDTSGIIRMDSLGNSLWIKKYRLFNGSAFYNMNTMTDGGFIACGVAQATTGTQTATHGIIMRTDSLGDSLWVKKFIGTNAAEFYETQQTDDGNIIIGGISGVLAIGNWGGYVLKLNMVGDTLWTKLLPLNEASNINSIHQCNDGGYITVGSVYRYSPPNPFDGNQNVFLFKMDSLGNIEWTKEFGALGEDEGGYYVRQSYDSGYIVTGVLDPGNFYLLKLNSSGDLSTGINTLTNDFVMKSYPNPTNGLINIECETGYFDVLLSDYSGKKIMQSFNNSNKTNIDLSVLSNGITLLQSIQTILRLPKK